MIYIVTENGLEYSHHLNRDEAEQYLKELKQVYPQSDWDLEPKTPGRLPGQTKMIWGAECVVDLLTLEIHQWMKIYLWEGERFVPPELHQDIYKYYPMRFAFTEESKGVNEVKRRLKDMRFKPIDGAVDRVVRYE